MSLDFVAGAVFMVGVLLIGSWLRDRWRYRLGSGRTLPPRPQHDTTDINTTDTDTETSQPRPAAGEVR